MSTFSIIAIIVIVVCSIGTVYGLHRAGQLMRREDQEESETTQSIKP